MKEPLDERPAGYIHTAFFLLVIGVFMLSIFMRVLTRQILIEKLHINNRIVKEVWWDNPNALVWDNGQIGNKNTVDWAAIYPFPYEEEQKKRDTKSQIWDKLGSFEKKIMHLKEQIVSYTEDMIIGKRKIVDSANKLEAMIGWDLQPLYTGVSVLEDGYLFRSAGKKDMTGAIGSINSLKQFLDENNIPMLYVQCPSKSCNEDLDIKGKSDFTNENVDELLLGLDSCNIPYLDFRKYIHMGEGNHHSYFYRTDPHWRIESGLWATGILAGYMNRHYGFDIDTSMYKPEKYNYEVYPEWFLGSEGRKVTTAKIKPDDFIVVTPEFKTSLRFQIKSYGIDKTGNFNIMLNEDQISRKDLYNKDPYSGYFYVGADLVETENLSEANPKKVLFIRDSFAGCVAPFLALGLSKTCSVDPRYFKGSLEALIKDMKPDMVIVMFYPNTIFAEVQQNNEHNCILDFR